MRRVLGIDTADILPSRRRILLRAGVPVNRMPSSRTLALVREAVTLFVEEARPVGVFEEISLEELLALKQNRLIDILRRDQPLFDGLPDLLERLAPRYALAVASGSNHPVIEEVLAMRQLGRFFSVVVSVQDVPRGKPAPDVFLRAAQMLAVPAARCCVVEDSAHGVEAARAAGMEVIAITNTLPSERLAAASHVVETYEEIESLLLEPVRDP